MNPFKNLRSFLAICIVASGLVANLRAHDAKVIKLTGAAQVQLPGQTVAQPLTLDMLVPEGALITTSADGQVFLEALPGVVATIEANSTVLVEKLSVTKQGETVTTQEAMLDLKKGNVISTLDPTKKAINRYAVRTPKGVAAARGTVYGVSVSLTGTTVATLSGSVTINLGNNVFVEIPVGMASVDSSDTVSRIQDAIAASGQSGLSVAQLLQETVEAVSANVAANTSAAGGSATSTAVLAGVVSAASSAQPEKAAQFTQTAVAAASSSTSATGGSDASISAITEAAVRANPNAAAEISQSAAKAVVETRVTEAVNAVKASGGTAADAAAAAATASEAAATSVQAIAQTVVNTAASTGSTVSAVNIVAATSSGSQQGAAEASTRTGTPVAPPPAPAPTAPVVNPSSAPIEAPATPVDLPPVSPS